MRRKKRKSGPAKYSQRKMTASFKPFHITYYTLTSRAGSEDDCVAPSAAVQRQTKQARGAAAVQAELPPTMGHIRPLATFTL